MSIEELEKIYKHANTWEFGNPVASAQGGKTTQAVLTAL
jgi:hypothetical protein